MRYLIITLALLLAAGASAEDPASGPDVSDCWVELYDEPTLEGDKVRLQGPIEEPKLANRAYSNGENLNDDVRGVRSGGTARVVLFGDANFAGAVYRVFPGSAIGIDKAGFGEDASSVRVTCDDPKAVSAPPPGSCWVELYDEPTLKGDKVRLEGRQAVAELASLEYSNGENLNDDVRGIRTGPAARVELFGDAGFKGAVYRVYEGSADSISAQGFGEEASSLKVTCLQ